MQRTAPVFALARFAFWIRAVRLHALFRLVIRIEDCDLRSLKCSPAVRTSHGLRVRDRFKCASNAN